MPHYILRYKTTSDYLSRREEFRAAHLNLGWAWADAGKLVLGGAFGEPPGGAFIVFKVDSPEEVKEFAEQDPYVTGGIVESYEVLPWHTVLGSTADKPLRP